MESAPPGDNRPADEAADLLRAQVRKLVLMKETGPKSAAWHRARVRAIWRLRRLAEMFQAARVRGEENERM